MNRSAKTGTETSKADLAARLGRTDAYALGLVGVLVLFFLLPALMQWVPVLHNDAADDLLPRAMAMARGLQTGAVPLWDFNTFAGARPFYLFDISPVYAPMLPLNLLARPDDAQQSTVMLALLPFVFHVLWAGLGGYLFGRLVVRLHPVGAWTLGFTYALCPEIASALTNLQNAFVCCHLPWVLLCVARFLETGRVRWWCAGAVALAVLSSLGVDNFTIRIYFLAAATAGLLWLSTCCGAAGLPDTVAGGRGAWLRTCAVFLPRLLATIGIFAAGTGLHGIGWLSLIESVGLMQASLPMTHELASGLLPESSMGCD